MKLTKLNFDETEFLQTDSEPPTYVDTLINLWVLEDHNGSN